MKKITCLIFLAIFVVAISAIDKICLLNIQSGLCDGRLTRYGYDVKAKKCKPFLYTGCTGNENRFLTLKECKAKCQEHLLEEEELPALDRRCLLKLQSGLCDGHLTRYGYDVKAKKCKPFLYTGCTGNENRFLTLEECEEKCKGKLLEDEA